MYSFKQLIVFQLETFCDYVFIQQLERTKTVLASFSPSVLDSCSRVVLSKTYKECNALQTKLYSVKTEMYDGL